MTVFKTTAEIFNTPWDNSFNAVPYAGSIASHPLRTDWLYSYGEPKLSDIEVWEQIYYQGGHVGVYAAWNPYVEFYMITYNLFMHESVGIKTFYGKNAGSEVLRHAKMLGVDLPLNTIPVREEESWLNTD
jgi:hypothetical protein